MSNDERSTNAQNSYISDGPRFMIRRLLNKVRFTAAVAVLTLAFSTGRSGAADKVSSLELPFTIQQEDDAAWLVRPNGKRFFSLGVCCVDQGASRKDFNSSNPAYAAWQHYADSNLWADATLRRLKSWGFSTVGGWSDF